jgi:peptide chain release factor 1
MHGCCLHDACLQVLRARLFEAEAQRRSRERGEAIAALVGSGERSERIRTYHYQQVTGMRDMDG